MFRDTILIQENVAGGPSKNVSRPLSLLSCFNPLASVSLPRVSRVQKMPSSSIVFKIIYFLIFLNMDAGLISFRQIVFNFQLPLSDMLLRIKATRWMVKLPIQHSSRCHRSIPSQWRIASKSSKTPDWRMVLFVRVHPNLIALEDASSSKRRQQQLQRQFSSAEKDRPPYPHDHRLARVAGSGSTGAKANAWPSLVSWLIDNLNHVNGPKLK